MTPTREVRVIEPIEGDWIVEAWFALDATGLPCTGLAVRGNVDTETPLEPGLGITQAVLRKVSMSLLRQHAAQKLFAGLELPKSRVQARMWSDIDYALYSLDYVLSGHNPHSTLAQRYATTPSRLRERTRGARVRGLLTSATPGRAASSLTPKALDILKSVSSSTRWVEGMVR